MQQQLRSLKSELGSIRADNVVVAYEPIWAIGTGISASPRDAEEMHGRIPALTLGMKVLVCVFCMEEVSIQTMRTS